MEEPEQDVPLDEGAPNLPDVFVRNIYCNHCKREHPHGDARQPFNDPHNNDRTWRLLSCSKCNALTFFLEEVEPGDLSQEYTYPARKPWEVKQLPNLPASVDQLYREIVTSVDTECYLLAAGGMRAMIEAVCSDRGVTEGRNPYYVPGRPGSQERNSSLASKIEGLGERGEISVRKVMMLHEHRILGNDALHELKFEDDVATKHALKVLESMLEEIYELSNSANLLAERRSLRSPDQSIGAQ